MNALTQPRGRLAWLDVARGVALLAMFAYHLTWDLSYFGLVARDIALTPPWKIFAHAIAGGFLFLAGISLTLAHGAGIRWPAFWRRFGMVAGAALLVSAGTWWFAPEAWVFFGILHCIAAASLIGLAFLRLPPLLTMAVALVLIALPFLLRESVFDPWPWWWLGLSAHEPLTLDYQPLLPNLGYALLGIVAAPFLPASGWKPRDPALRLLGFGGRHSLAVYLVHQPVFLAVLALLAHLAGPAAPDDAAFLRACETQCGANGGAAPLCQATCRCTVDGLKAQGIWSNALRNALNPDETRRMGAVIAACQR